MMEFLPSFPCRPLAHAVVPPFPAWTGKLNFHSALKTFLHISFKFLCLQFLSGCPEESWNDCFVPQNYFFRNGYKWKKRHHHILYWKWLSWKITLTWKNSFAWNDKFEVQFVNTLRKINKKTQNTQVCRWMKMWQTAASFGGREGVCGAGDNGGDGQEQLRSGGRPGRFHRAAHRGGQGPLRDKDVSRRKPHEGKLYSTGWLWWSST